jgi:hypothetical protein
MTVSRLRHIPGIGVDRVGDAADATHDPPEHLPEDQVQHPQRHVGIMSIRRSPLVTT